MLSALTSPASTPPPAMAQRAGLMPVLLTQPPPLFLLLRAIGAEEAGSAGDGAASPHLNG